MSRKNVRLSILLQQLTVVSRLKMKDVVIILNVIKVKVKVKVKVKHMKDLPREDC